MLHSLYDEEIMSSENILRDPLWTEAEVVPASLRGTDP